LKHACPDVVPDDALAGFPAMGELRQGEARQAPQRVRIDGSPHGQTRREGLARLRRRLPSRRVQPLLGRNLRYSSGCVEARPQGLVAAAPCLSAQGHSVRSERGRRGLSRLRRPDLLDNPATSPKLPVATFQAKAARQFDLASFSTTSTSSLDGEFSFVEIETKLTKLLFLVCEAMAAFALFHGFFGDFEKPVQGSQGDAGGGSHDAAVRPVLAAARMIVWTRGVQALGRPPVRLRLLRSSSTTFSGCLMP